MRGACWGTGVELWVVTRDGARGRLRVGANRDAGVGLCAGTGDGAGVGLCVGTSSGIAVRRGKRTWLGAGL